MSDWHVEIGKRLITIDETLQVLTKNNIDTGETLRELVVAIENLMQEFYLLRGETKKINLLLDMILDENREMKEGVGDIYG
jgi:hypothetical protein